MKLLTALIIPTLLLATANEPLITIKNNPVKIEIQKPISKVSFGKGIDLIVKALGLNIDNIRFIKAPKATDYVVKADNKAYYAQSIIIAACNGIKLNRSMNPAASMTREQFAIGLNEGIQGTGNYPVNMMWLQVNDEKKFGQGGLASVQNLVKFNVVKLENGNFRPKALITATEAAKMLNLAAAFVKAHREANVEGRTYEEVTLTSSAVNSEVNKIVLSRGEKPNSGYQIIINRIVFTASEATVHYQLSDPKSGNSYLQVITNPKAETFIGSMYKIKLQKD
ncbi:protease complex subunit PrcB family protein [Pedobacter sp. MC2016-24]|uniref:protease complex subunit PrcB family protein n=1 Tax=Pedobacter sp. MC2016-24 TaxID=2780090 RepID=UPI00187E5076|nr:protease complex subunit PrcB family protein [Pedobacter sp. MC2016-24]MBE9598148.1 protease complex subunit PrcB family protein [Pedobacter sp. MC2016-24]